MAKFRVTNTPPPIQPGWGPPAVCASCKFPNNTSEYYVVFEDVFAELNYDVSGTSVDATHPIVLCSFCVQNDLAPLVFDLVPDERLPQAQAKLFQAEAARARAEKRADAAETALAAMQELKAVKDAK